MFAQKHYPERMSSEELDDYLSQGWYRMGQTIFTTHFLHFYQSFYSAIWIRLPLTGYQFSKSLRKNMRRNGKRFKTITRKGSITPAHEQLYRLYKADFSGMLAPSLKDALFDGEASNLFNTYEVSVYDGRHLIAFSYFDLGKKSAASITGVFHPDYKSHSLGLYTMLVEIAYCQSQQFQFYYPGYVVPGYPRFDYKLRIGPVEYYALRSLTWEPFSTLAKDTVPIREMNHQLVLMQQYLEQNGYVAVKQYYPLFEANLFGFWHAPYFDYPVFLLCSEREAEHFLIIVFNPVQSAYQLLHCSIFDDLQFYFNESYMKSFNSNTHFLHLLVEEEELASSADKELLLETLAMIA